MKQKHKKKSHKRGWIGKILFFLLLIGIVVTLFFLFRQEIFDSIKPWFEKRGILRERKEVTLYFSDQEGEYLVGEKRKILKRKDVEEEAEETIIELIRGPRGKLIRTLPPQTKLVTLKIDEKGVARVNFDKTLSKDHPGGSSAEIMSIYSIVNSLTLNFLQIKRVQILIEGETGESIAGHLILDQPISSKTDLIRRQ
jgi:spore germination protein GerM